ncbi:HEAT repeat domain-containing protein [Paludisphaera soli]|uniref:HEAT repeat domain-containing protein n=1 Tax=Paludisphaera soli TaxID=2712865 RepID=UPI0013EB6CBD|nr:HEAT repeat domain-containing protein [Paludisphaera soli]
MSDLMTEIRRFRDWAGDDPPATRSQEGLLVHADGEWESDYPHWTDLYAAVMEHMSARPRERWSAEELQAVLYALARDNEDEHLVWEIRAHHPATLIALASAVLAGGEFDARWQLADQLGFLDRDAGDVERLLLDFARDEDEYIRRRAIKSLARLGCPAAEHLALEAWHRPHENQQWARMVALDCLRRIGSPHLEPLLAEAERDERPHLRDFAARMRQRRVE